MCIRYLGLILMIWFPGVLHAQSAAQPCPAPKLRGGYLVPEEDTYSHDIKLSYACNNGHKPVVEGWWATSTCQNGTWSHEPQCIDKDACIQPDIPNAKYSQEGKGWYKNGFIIRITCHDGYVPKDWQATAACTNGTWSSLPVCEKSLQACNAPPKIPHAVIINQGYQDVFPPDSEVQYKCEDGFTVEGADTKSLCIAGNWTTGPSCKSRETGPSAGRDESTVGGPDIGTRPSAGHGGSSTTSERDSKPLITTTDYCGRVPNLPNGDVLFKDVMFLKYQCKAFYTQVGSETVVCYNDGTWSNLPVCKEAFCTIIPAQFVGTNIRPSAAEYIREGETKSVPCIWYYYSSRFQCTNGRISVTECCRYDDHYRGACPKIHQLFGSLTTN